jgi:hypothetical protein
VGCGKTVWINSSSVVSRFHRDREALNEFGDLGAGHMRAQELSGRRVEDRLDEPTVFPKRDRLAVPGEGKAPDARLVPSRLRARLSEADAGDLRPTVGAA